MLFIEFTAKIWLKFNLDKAFHQRKPFLKNYPKSNDLLFEFFTNVYFLNSTFKNTELGFK